MTSKNTSSQAAPAVSPITASLAEFIEERKSRIDDALSAARANHNTFAEIVLEAAWFLCGHLIYADKRWYQGWLDLAPYCICHESGAEIAVQDAMIRKLEGIEHPEHCFTPNGVRAVFRLVRPWLTVPDRLIPTIIELSDPGE